MNSIVHHHEASVYYYWLHVGILDLKGIRSTYDCKLLDVRPTWKPAELGCGCAGSADFDKVVNGGKHALVEFYAPWYAIRLSKPL